MSAASKKGRHRETAEARPQIDQPALVADGQIDAKTSLAGQCTCRWSNFKPATDEETGKPTFVSVAGYRIADPDCPVHDHGQYVDPIERAAEAKAKRRGKA